MKMRERKGHAKYLRILKNYLYPNRLFRTITGRNLFIHKYPMRLWKAVLFTKRSKGSLSLQKAYIFDAKGEFTTFWFDNNIPYWKAAFSERSSSIGRCLEIGCWEGRSTVFTAKLFPQAKITCIDTFKGRDEHSSKNVSEIERRFLNNTSQISRRLEIFKEYSCNALTELCKDRSESYDFIYIDGSHFFSDVMLDTLLCWKLLKCDGFLVWDDYLWTHKPYKQLVPKPAIDCFLEAYRGHYKPVFAHWQIAIQKTKSEQETRGL